MGDWTVIRRDNGLLQWAYRGKPVYSMFHDAPNTPRGDGEGGVWHLLPYEK
jgi:predicted lipoprotein with Yx(FWY)xxD motif